MIFRIFGVLIAGCSLSAAPSPRAWTIPLTACKAMGGRAEAMCGSYEVFENRAARSGRKIKLNLMVFPALDAAPLSDPLFPLAGGPGEAAVQAYQGLAMQYHQKRDVVLVDQRGTGGSNLLTCNWKEDVASSFARIVPIDELRSCREQLAKTADLRQYITSVAMDDLDEVRAALGYEQINVYGGSYGTTAGLEYLRRHGDHVRTLTLLAVVPPSFRVPLPFPHTVQKSLEGLFARCDADPGCHAEFPKLRDESRAVLDRLARAPAKFSFTSPPTIKEPVEVTLSADMFGDFLRRILYTVPGMSLLPMAIDSAWHGDFEMFARLCYELSIRTNPTIPYGMYYSILCNESFPFITEREAAFMTRDTYIGDYRLVQQRAACVGWPDAGVPASFVEPVKSDRPVLLVSGELDPAAQPEYAADATKSLSRGRHIVVRNGSHGVGGQCIAGIVAHFIDAGSANGLDASCVDAIKLAPFRLHDPKHSGMTAKAMAEFAGTYEAAPDVNYVFRAEDSIMMVQFPGAPGEVAMYPMSENQIYMLGGQGEVEFLRDPDGAVKRLVVHLSGRDLPMTRK